MQFVMENRKQLRAPLLYKAGLLRRLRMVKGILAPRIEAGEEAREMIVTERVKERRKEEIGASAKAMGPVVVGDEAIEAKK
jgi:hypothetical protein